MADTRYSVRRATTENERSQRVERVKVPPPPATSREAKWHVEVEGVRVVLRKDGTEIELTVDEARALAATIVERTS